MYTLITQVTFMELQIYPYLLLLIILITTVKLTLTYKRNRKLPPGLNKLPIIGNLHQLRSDYPHRKLQELAKKNKYSDLMHLKLGHVDHIFVFSAEIAKEIMTTHDRNFSSRPFLVGPSIIGYNNKSVTFAPIGDYWRLMRKLCVLELLSPKRVKSFSSIRREENRKLVSNISSKCNCAVNVTMMVVDLMANQTSKAAFGAKFDQTERFMKDARKAIELSSGFTLIDFFPRIPFLGDMIGISSKLKHAHNELDVILTEIVEEKQRRSRSGKNHDGGGDDGLVDILLSMYNDKTSEYDLTLTMIKSIIFEMIVGGTETTAATVTWAMVELLRHPEIMKKVQHEIRTVSKNKANVEEEDLQSMRYMKHVVMETLRMYPPLPLLLPRECSESTSIMGYEIPSGSRVIVNAWAIGRDSRYWEEGGSFKPERFDGDDEFKEVDYLGKRRLGYLLFGGGRRTCPGINFGTISVELVLANLLFHFDWKLPEGTTADDLDMTETVGSSITRKEELWLVAEPYKFSEFRRDSE